MAIITTLTRHAILLPDAGVIHSRSPLLGVRYTSGQIQDTKKVFRFFGARRVRVDDTSRRRHALCAVTDG